MEVGQALHVHPRPGKAYSDGGYAYICNIRNCDRTPGPVYVVVDGRDGEYLSHIFYYKADVKPLHRTYVLIIQL